MYSERSQKGMYDNAMMNRLRAQAVRKMWKAGNALKCYLLQHGYLLSEEDEALEKHTCDAVAFNRMLRRLYVPVTSRTGKDGRKVDSVLLWHAIDASGFIEDATPGRWPYAKETEWRRFLVQALQYCNELNIMLKFQSANTGKFKSVA